MASNISEQYLLQSTNSYSVFASKPIGELKEGETVTFTIERKGATGSAETLHWEITEAGDELQSILDIHGTLGDMYANGDRSTVLLSSFDSDMAGDVVFEAGQTTASITVAIHDDPSISSNPYRSFPLVLTPENSDSFTVNYGVADGQSKTLELSPNQGAQFMTEGGIPVEIKTDLEANTPYTITLSELHAGGDLSANESPFTLDSFVTFDIYNAQGELVTPTIEEDATSITFVPSESGQYRIVIMGDRATHDVSITPTDSSTDISTPITYINFAQDDSQVDTTDTSFELELSTNTLTRPITLYSSVDPDQLDEGQEAIITVERSTNLELDETFVWAINLDTYLRDYSVLEGIDWDDIDAELPDEQDFIVPSYQRAVWSDLDSQLTGLLHFAAGETQASFSITAADDQTLEYTAEHFTVAVTAITELPNIAGTTVTIPVIKEAEDGSLELDEKVITETLTPADTLTNSAQTTFTIIDNEAALQTMSVDEQITFVQNNATPVEVQVELSTAGQYISDLTVLESSEYNMADITIIDSQGNTVEASQTLDGSVLTFDVTESNTGRYSFVVDSEQGEGWFDLEVYKDYSQDALQFFQNNDNALANAIDFVLTAVQNNDIALIHQQAQDYGVNAELLSGIVQAAGLNSISVNDVNQYFTDAGLSAL